MNELEEGIRLKSWDEWKAGASAAAGRLNRNVFQPAGRAIQGLRSLMSPKPTASPARPGGTGGPEGVGTKSDNKKATGLSVQPHQYRKGDSQETAARNNARKAGPLRPGDVYIKRSPNDGLPKVKLDKNNRPIPNQYGVE